MTSKSDWYSVAIFISMASCGSTHFPARAVSTPTANAKKTVTMPRDFGDADISAVVLARLRSDPGVEAGSVHVRATQGIVELTGSAPDLLTKRRAVRVAEAVKGVRAVSDRLELNLQERPDAALEADVSTALKQNQATEAYGVSVKVRQGAVTLTGTVDSYQARQVCEWLAEGVAGVRKVDNRIDVRWAMDRPDAEVAADVTSRLRWDALVNDARIRVEVIDGTATLKGQVASAAERRRASSDAWVVGVRRVDDSKLTVVSWRPDLLKHERFGPSDLQIAKAVGDAAAYDPRLSAADLHPSVNAGLVTLRGSVGSIAGKFAAEDLARHTVGVLAVKNELIVKPFQHVTDVGLEAKVRDALMWDPYTDLFNIEVKAADGKVTLNGNVSTAFERAQATNVASSIEGVIDIDNHLTVAHPERGYVYHPFYYPYGPYWQTWLFTPTSRIGSDAEIESNVRQHLDWSPFVDSSVVTVEVVQGRATLKGRVGSQSQRIAATVSAYEGGAVFVDNQLTIFP
jgi:osmotically-inducible protein OsmY